MPPTLYLIVRGRLLDRRDLRSSLPILPVLLILLILMAAGSPAHAQAAALHTDPLNLDPVVRSGYLHFYNLEYDAALSDFDRIIAAHPQEPIAYAYALQALIFRELYHQDLLDTTYYARNSFLSNPRQVQIGSDARKRIEFLAEKVSDLADARLKANSSDKNALFARGFARGLHASFMTLVDHSYLGAARQGLAARNDSEAVLKIDPEYADANLAIGIQQFAVASLPRLLRLAVGIAGVGGSRQKGLDLLQISAQHGVITSVESRTTLSLFLRHDGRYAEAFAVEHMLAQQYPHDYLFRLEEANITKDEGQAAQAIEIYKAVLADARRPKYFYDPHLALAWFGLAETERGQGRFAEAQKFYLEAAGQQNSSDWMRRRAELSAGQMYDLLHDHASAVAQYQKVLSPGGDQSQASLARHLIDNAYDGK